MFNIKHNLKRACFLALFCGLWGFFPAWAQDTPAAPAVPVAPVMAEAVATPAIVLAEGPVVIELFSSQACVFCPRADRLLADLAQQAHVIALACHVDYFDVREGALSHPFCTARQNWYMRALRAGPNYTPQMVVQGRHDVLGYDIPAVTEALQKAAQEIPPAIAIAYSGAADRYRLTLPGTGEDRSYRLWLMAYDRPADVVVSEGRNKGQRMQYVNVVSALQDLGVWNARELDEMEIEFTRKDSQKGFAVLAQDEKTGAIGAAGRYLFGQAKSAERSLND